MEINIIEFNNKEYYLLKEIVYNNQTYCYFMNVDNKLDLCVKKLINKDNEEYYVGLKDENELKEAIKKFSLDEIDGRD